MDRDERMQNFPAALANCMGELVDAGVTPAAVACETATGLRIFVGRHMPGDQAAALLREQAALVERPDRSRLPETDRELIELQEKASQFIRTLQLAGVSENSAVSALHQACILAVVRTRGGPAAVAWLRAIADRTEEMLPVIEHLAKAS